MTKKPAWSVQELKNLKQIHTLMLALEKTAGENPARGFLAKDFAPIFSALKLLEASEHFELRKIAEIQKHLRPEMTPQQFSSWLVPVERALGRELRDDQFLIFTKDAEAPRAFSSAGSAAVSATAAETNATATEKIPLVFILDNLRSAFNVGSIFRTAECFGVEKIYLAGYTPLPDQEKLAKTAMGTDTLVAWESAPKILELVSRLKSDGYKIIAFETTSHAVEVQTEFAAGPTAFVFGNERFGLEPSLLELCHEVRKIPLRGQKNSLNVGVATAIATYEFAKQRTARPQSTPHATSQTSPQKASPK